MYFESLASYFHGLLVLSFTIYLYTVSRTQKSTKKTEAALSLGNWSVWMPRTLHNAMYGFKASMLLEHGYKKFKNKAFQLIRNDGNIIILPHSLLEQLSSLPGTIASPHGALEQDLLGPHTGLNLILESRLHHSIVQRKLTPRLPLMSPRLEEELVAAINNHFPDGVVKGSQEWTTFQPYQILAKISAQVSARALVGPRLCQNDAWLDVSVNYTESLFRTIIVLRFFPAWMHSLLRYLLPSYWNGVRYVRTAKHVLGPIIQELVEKNNRGEWTSAEVDEPSVLHWLVDTAKGRDRNAETLAHVEVLLALASVHTTLLRMVNVLYDVTANYGYIQELRDEIQETFEAEDGKWTYAAYARLEKLDSVLRESQRMSPPTILGLKRLFKQSFTFEDGTHIPQGMYVTMPIYAIENDARITPNPNVFDGLRHYRLRHMNDSKGCNPSKTATKREEYQFSSPEPTALNFGYGKTACPGRYFAGLVIKMVFVKLLIEYDFRFRNGGGRPRNIQVHEFLFCWPWHKMEMKKRDHATCPF
ncbi:cytochrome P450 [Periconia macrospinosa]|uniref:Cytochrome P450 n=1 Tax=Periconia macrospinosa TaxID=97972 RepID=A0A2V1DIG9_9PLEO|nr:cytochrome P450 [Periconia macrospinosa]